MASDSQSKNEKAFEDMDIVSQQKEIIKALRELAESIEELKQKKAQREGEKKV